MARRLRISLKSLSRGIDKVTRKVKGGLTKAAPPQRTKLQLFVQELGRCKQAAQSICDEMDIIIVPGKERRR